MPFDPVLITDIGSAFQEMIIADPDIGPLLRVDAGQGVKYRVYPNSLPQDLRIPPQESQPNVYAVVYSIVVAYNQTHLQGQGGLSIDRLRLMHYGPDRTKTLNFTNYLRDRLLQGAGRQQWPSVYVNGIEPEIGPIDTADLPRDGSDYRRPGILMDYSVSWTIPIRSF